MYRQFLAEAKAINPHLRVVGLTATPFRLDSGSICAADHFLNAVCYEVGVKELIRDGYLCPLVSKASVTKADTSGLHVRAGEFVADEVEGLMDADGLVEAACAEIAGAGAVVLYGCGREGLMMRALATRLHHLGLRVAMQGDMAAPPVGPGDLLIVSAGPGERATVSALMAVASRDGARVLFLTAETEAAAAGRADRVLVIPAQTMARDRAPDAGVLPMGSVYEAALFFLFEIMVLRLRDSLGVSPGAMRARHTNLE